MLVLHLNVFLKPVAGVKRPINKGLRYPFVAVEAVFSCSPISFHPTSTHPTRMSPSLLPKVPNPVDTRVTGKVTRAVLEKVFGSSLLATLKPHDTGPTTNIEGVLPRAQSETEKDGGADCETEPDVPPGTDSVDGKLQVGGV